MRSDIKRINDLKGKILVTAQFTEAEFFIRYLAQEAGLEINALPTFQAPPDPDKLNLIFCDDAFVAGDLSIEELNKGGTRLAGAVTWSPKTTEIVTESNGKAVILTTNLPQEKPAKSDATVHLGNFSVSLTVKDIKISKAFYEKLDFKQVAGKVEQNWVVLQNGTTTRSSSRCFHALRARAMTIAQGTARMAQISDVAVLNHSVRQRIGRYCSSRRARQ